MSNQLATNDNRIDSHAVGVFSSMENFTNGQRMVKALLDSKMLPRDYQGNMGDCLIALDMAQRLNANPMLIMQNMDVIHGKPAWSAKFLIACVNKSGKFTPIRYEFKGTEGADDWACRAWANDLIAGERLDGTWISIGMAKREGWYDKNGSKWKTMPEQMLRYRAAAFFIRAYAPEITMGMLTEDEVRDTVIDITPENSADKMNMIIEQSQESDKTDLQSISPEVAQKPSKLPESPADFFKDAPPEPQAKPKPQTKISMNI